jgi:hypothetical protein
MNSSISVVVSKSIRMDRVIAASFGDYQTIIPSSKERKQYSDSNSSSDVMCNFVIAQ